MVEQKSFEELALQKNESFLLFPFSGPSPITDLLII